MIAELPPRAGDSAIDWSRVKNHRQWKNYQANDKSFAEVIDKDVLQKGHRALVILGSAHVARLSDPDSSPNTTSLLERVHPGSMYVVLLSLQRPEATSPIGPPMLAPWLPVLLPDGRKVFGGEYGDALLYLGSPLTTASPDWPAYEEDRSYLEELNRRALIQWGCAFDLQRFEQGLPVCH